MEQQQDSDRRPATLQWGRTREGPEMVPTIPYLSHVLAGFNGAGPVRVRRCVRISHATGITEPASMGPDP